MTVTLHPAVSTVVVRIRDDLIGGAADMAKESADALAAVARDSTARTPEALGTEVRVAALAILDVTPSIAPVINLLHRVLQLVEASEGPVEELRAGVLQRTGNFRRELEEALERIGEFGAAMLADGDRVFMYSLSTTVWRVFRKAHARGTRFEVVVTESRPANEGLQTVAEMSRLGVPVTVGIDAAIGVLMRGCTLFMVGADAVRGTGHVLCKVGTFPAALVARHLGIPFYVAIDTTKFDPLSLHGVPFKIREMPATDVMPQGSLPHARVRNPVFDVTPPGLITGLITERGVIAPTACFEVMQGMPRSRILRERLQGLTGA